MVESEQELKNLLTRVKEDSEEVGLKFNMKTWPFHLSPYKDVSGIKIVRRNINNLRYADDITLMAEREEELKSLLMKVKEEGGGPKMAEE